MTKRRVFFLTLPSGIFGNGGQTWLGIDLNPIKKRLNSFGFISLDGTIDRVQELDLRPDDIVVYCSCEAPEIREYMKDTFYFLRSKCRLVPDYDFLLAYENKGFQELKRKALGLGNLRGSYFFDTETHEQCFPYVFKTLSGAGSSGVRLVRSPADLRIIRRDLFGTTLRRRIIRLHRKYFLNQEHYAAYSYRHRGFLRHVVQEFIPNLKNDYKVLIFGTKFFGLKRYVRKNDFRASGSGKFDFTAPIPEQVLDFASEIAFKLDAPQLSLDIAHSGDGCHLIEYQALNFGPITLSKSEGYYLHRDEGWEFIKGRSDLSECFADSLISYFERHNIMAIA